MPRFWTCHWQFRYWRPDINPEGEPIGISLSNIFRKRGVKKGDVAYIISLTAGRLYLGGRMTVKAVELFKKKRTFPANECIIASKGTGTLLNLHRALSLELTKQLRFVSPSGPKQLAFVSNTQLDSQTTRGVRELTVESAALLDRIIDFTDQLPKSNRLLVVTDEMLDGGEIGDNRLPEEVPTKYRDGNVSRIEVNRYERDPRARKACIAKHGTSCCICGFNFGAAYGEVAEGLIHVHHLHPLSKIARNYQVDPIADLRPVCPNCHAVIHWRCEARTIDEVRSFLNGSKRRLIASES